MKYFEKIYLSISKSFQKDIATKLLAISPLKFCDTCQKFVIEKLETSSKETNK